MNEDQLTRAIEIKTELKKLQSHMESLKYASEHDAHLFIHYKAGCVASNPIELMKADLSIDFMKEYVKSISNRITALKKEFDEL